MRFTTGICGSWRTNKRNTPGQTTRRGEWRYGTELQRTSSEDGPREHRRQPGTGARRATADGAGRITLRETGDTERHGRPAGCSSELDLAYRATCRYVSQHAAELHSGDGRRAPDSGNLSRWRHCHY